MKKIKFLKNQPDNIWKLNPHIFRPERELFSSLALFLAVMTMATVPSGVWAAFGNGTSNISFSNPQVTLMLFLSSFAACILAIMVFVEKEVTKHKKKNKK